MKRLINIAGFFALVYMTISTCFLAFLIIYFYKSPYFYFSFGSWELTADLAGLGILLPFAIWGLYRYWKGLKC